MIKSKNDTDPITDALDQLFLDGILLAACPICNIPLNETEYFNCTCEKCGPIDFDNILFQNVDVNNLS